MPSPARFLFLLLLVAGALQAQSSLDNARRAQALLGPEVWSRVIRVENSTRLSPYPRIVHALVFELAGILWFYTDTDGTQSFSLHQDNLAEEKADFAPLLRDIEPGFGRWRIMSDAGAPSASAAGPEPLRNGCFIESVAALRERVARGMRTEAARLLSYYTATREGKRGHTVLTWLDGDAMHLFDPARRDEAVTLPAAEAADAFALARAVFGRAVVKARYLPLDLPPAPIIAGAPVFVPTGVLPDTAATGS